VAAMIARAASEWAGMGWNPRVTSSAEVRLPPRKHPCPVRKYRTTSSSRDV